MDSGLRQFPLIRGLQSFGWINQFEDEVAIILEHPTDPNTPPIQWFIHGTQTKQGVVKPLCEKYGLQFGMELDENSLLKAIVISGPILEKKQVDELIHGATWAFRRALEDQTDKEKKQ